MTRPPSEPDCPKRSVSPLVHPLVRYSPGTGHAMKSTCLAMMDPQAAYLQLALLRSSHFFIILVTFSSPDLYHTAWRLQQGWTLYGGCRETQWKKIVYRERRKRVGDKTEPWGHTRHFRALRVYAPPLPPPTISASLSLQSSLPSDTHTL